MINTAELDGQASAASTMLIDTDIHEMLSSKRDLAPYMDDHWRTVVETYYFDAAPMAPNIGWVVGPPSAGARPEWTQVQTDDGAEAIAPGQSLDGVRQHVFEGEGVTHGILNGLFYPDAYPAHFEFAAALASAYNEWQIDRWLDPEPRLFGSVHVVTDDPRVAAAEIDRVAAHPQIVQVLLPTSSRKQYGAPIYRPIFEAAARNDLVIAMHQYAGHTTNPALGVPRTFFEWHTLAAPQAGAAHIMSLIAGGVFDLFPDLKVVLLEAGVTWVPWLMWRADENYKEFRSEVPWVKRLPSEHIRDNVRLSTQPLGDIKWRDFIKLVEMVDAQDMFVFSTDYPHYDADSFDTVFPRGMPEELRTKIRSANALATYPRLRHLASSH
jgi:predicted TIM-barrel fold metal-dependent hydrolase